MVRCITCTNAYMLEQWTMEHESTKPCKFVCENICKNPLLKIFATTKV
jgi:hypothetical protein